MSNLPAEQSEDIMDMDQFLAERVLELYGTETMELDQEYQKTILLNRIQTTYQPPLSHKEQLKAEAKYKCEAAAKLTSYSIEPTFHILSTIRAIPIVSNDQVTKAPVTDQASSSNEVNIEPQNTPTTGQTKMSNNSMRKTQYKENRKKARQQKHQQHRTANPQDK